MRNHLCSKLLAAALSLCLLLTMLPLSALPVHAESTTYVLDVGELEDVGKGTKADGDTLKCGTDNFFTIFFSAKAQIQANEKTFSDGFSATKRLHYGASTKIEDPVLNAIQIKPTGPATVKIWWVSGDPNRGIGIYREDGTILAQTSVASEKNQLSVSELSISDAGTYYIGNVGGNNYHYKVLIES